MEIHDPTLPVHHVDGEWNKARACLDLAQVIFVIIDRDESVGLINRHGCEVLGYPREEIIGRNWFDRYLPPPAREEARAAFRRVVNGLADPGLSFEHPVLTASGGRRLVAWHSGVLTDSTGHIISTIGSGQDVTERRLAQAQIERDQHQLRALVSELVVAEERERRRIAVTLHDGLNQTLQLMKMKLALFDESPARGELVALVDEAVGTAGSLSFELSPPVLYDLGLEAALQWLADDMHTRYGLPVELHGDGSWPRLEDRLSIILFRAIRELLINVARHSTATKATVGLAERQGCVWVTVGDDGPGFAPTFDLNNLDPGSGETGFGLFSIRQRLIQLGGCMDISSAPGSTLITLVVPHPAGQAEGTQ